MVNYGFIRRIDGMGLKEIHENIAHILNVQLNAVRCLIEQHNLSSAILECTLIDINLRRELEKLKEVA